MTSARSPQRHYANRTAFRPRLERLEVRSVPATFNVTTTLDVVDPADGKRSLREAITAANNLAGADVIVLPAGVYKIALTGAGEDANATGDFDIAGSVTIQGAGTGATVIDGQQLDRVFDVFGTAPSSIKVVFAGQTVRNGNVNGHGGGIRVGNADLIVRDSAITANQASQTGGGISNAAAPGTGKITMVRATVARNVAGTNGGGVSSLSNVLTVRDSTVHRNIATNSGGGINATTPTLTNCTISNNLARFSGGGGINATTPTLTNCTISNNLAQSSDGGGIIATTVTLTNCTVSGNSTVDSGGGIIATTANLTRTTVSANSAGVDGGGISAVTANLTNSTISGNSAAQFGGGVLASAATLFNCTIVENSAQGGGGLSHAGVGTFTLKNTLVALNLTAFGGGPDVLGTFVSDGHNLIGVGNASFTNGVTGDIVGTSVNPIDPKIGPLRNNSGPTKTHELLAGSRAIDKGDNTNLPPTDQRGIGFPRKKDGNGDGVAVVDIGAFEK
jgi:CSLREA domain-containing protein